MSRKTRIEQQWCGGRDHLWSPNRREFLRVGAVTGLGLTLGEFFRLQAGEDWKDLARPSQEGRAKSVINIFLPGGIAQHESWDPKFLAPIEYRGPFGTVETAIKGERLSETMPETAKIADKITIVRSMTHGEAAHERGTHNMMTGTKPSPAAVFPSLGSVVANQMGPRHNLPPYVAIPSITAYGGSGYLGSAFGPFSLGADPGNSNFQVRDLSLPGGVGEEQFERRRRMREVVDTHFRSLEKVDALAGMDSFYQRAYAMISSPKAREAFDLEKEPAALRDQYGRNSAGGRFLLARRLVEAGVRFVSTTFGGWDHHNNIRDGVKGQMPEFDRAYAALIRDLDQRGFLNSTLVMVTTEFGRTPKLNQNAGRDHWPKVFSIALAGGGIKRGLVYGSSDPTGSEPEDDPVTVEDWGATVYTLIGIDPARRLIGPGNRPMPINYDGNVIKEMLA